MICWFQYMSAATALSACCVYLKSVKNGSQFFSGHDCNMGPGCCILWIICGRGQIVWDSRRLNQGQGDPSQRCQSASSSIHPRLGSDFPVTWCHYCGCRDGEDSSTFSQIGCQMAHRIRSAKDWMAWTNLRLPSTLWACFSAAFIQFSAF